jgi:antitoxin YefM
MPYEIAYRQELPVSRLRLSRDIRPLSEFRANTAAFVRHVQESRQPLVLTQHGRSAAVLLGISEYERLLERAELLEDIAVPAIALKWDPLDWLSLRTSWGKTFSQVNPPADAGPADPGAPPAGVLARSKLPVLVAR